MYLGMAQASATKSWYIDRIKVTWDPNKTSQDRVADILRQIQGSSTDQGGDIPLYSGDLTAYHASKLQSLFPDVRITFEAPPETAWEAEERTPTIQEISAYQLQKRVSEGYQAPVTVAPSGGGSTVPVITAGNGAAAPAPTVVVNGGSQKKTEFPWGLVMAGLAALAIWRK